MGLSAVGSVLSSLVSQISSKPAATTTVPTSQSSTQDSTQLHPIASLFSQLDQLDQQNPQAFQSFLKQAQTEVDSAASTQPEGQTKTFLHALSGVFQRAQADPGQPLSFLHPGNGDPITSNPFAENLVQNLNNQASQALNFTSPSSQ
jgi:hypothetical protein